MAKVNRRTATVQEWASLLKAQTQKGAGCWVWIGSVDRHGYGRSQLGGAMRRMHRVAWELKNGPVPAGQMVLHRCDNPRCCNPVHLFLGDDATNAQDKARKGRAYTGEHSGESNWNAILTNEQAAAVARCIMDGADTATIKEQTGVDRNDIISAIRTGRGWAKASASVGYFPPRQKA